MAGDGMPVDVRAADGTGDHRRAGKTTGWSRSTTLTLLRRLEDKGAVSAVSEGGMKHYRPQVAREDAAVQETEHLLERVYQGSVSLMVSSLVKKQTLSQEEIDKLYAILREMEEEHD